MLTTLIVISSQHRISRKNQTQKTNNFHNLILYPEKKNRSHKGSLINRKHLHSVKYFFCKEGAMKGITLVAQE
jgi:hypothetical protein